MTVKWCSTCGERVPEDATVCQRCGSLAPVAPTVGVDSRGSVPPPNAKPLNAGASSPGPEPVDYGVALPRRWLLIYGVLDHWRLALTTTAVVALTLILAVVGLPGGGGGSGAFPPLAQAETKLQELGSVRIHLRERVQNRGTNQRLVITGHGVSALSSGNGRFSMRVSGASPTGGSTSEQPIADGGRMILIYRDPWIYFGGPLFARQLPDDATWMKIDLERAGANGIDPQGEQGVAQGNPADLLPYLRAAGEVQDLGTARVNGRPTTHYRAHVSPEGYASVLRSEGQAQAAESVQSAVERGLRVGGIDVWVDEQQRVRRMELAFSMPSPAGGTVQVSVAMGLSDYGARVPATRPPAGKVYDATSLAQDSAGDSGGYLSPKAARAAGEIPPAPSHAGQMTSDWKAFAERVDYTCASVFNASEAARIQADRKAASQGVPGYKRSSIGWTYMANAQEREYQLVKAMGDPPEKAALFHRWLENAGERAQLMRTMSEAWANQDGPLESRTNARITQLKVKANHLGQRFGLRICTSNGPR
jgi:hypothetical protein